MDAIGTHELRRLAGEQNGTCVSIYLATHVEGEDGQQDAVRLKNLVQQAQQQLTTAGVRSAEARRRTQPARALPGEPSFWEHRSHGLALFLAPDAFYCYRLPLAFPEFVLVNRRFHLKPLLAALTGEERFFLLALSQNNVRFFSGSREKLEEVSLPHLVTSMREALNYAEVDRGAQVHSAFRGSGGKQAAVFHGQGGQPDTRKEEITWFFRHVDTALHPLLRRETAPLMLAGVEYLLPLFREITDYPHLAEQELIGNWDHHSHHQLHERAWPLIAPVFRRNRQEAADRYLQLAATDRSSADLPQILSAAHQGRIEILFVDRKSHRWGRFHDGTMDTELHQERVDGDEDLLDLAAVQTLIHRGTVHCVPRAEIPDNQTIAALFRY